MPFERRSHMDRKAGMGSHQFRHKLWKIPFQVEPEREEIRDDDDPSDAKHGKFGHGAGQVGPSQFEECRFDVRERTGSG